MRPPAAVVGATGHAMAYAGRAVLLRAIAEVARIANPGGDGWAAAVDNAGATCVDQALEDWALDAPMDTLKVERADGSVFEWGACDTECVATPSSWVLVAAVSADDHADDAFWDARCGAFGALRGGVEPHVRRGRVCCSVCEGRELRMSKE